MSQAGALSGNGGGGGGTADIQKINVQTGTSPVVTTNNTIIFNGAVVAAGTNPVRTDGTAPATMALEVQTSQAIASTNASNIGLAAFNSADFTVDGNGFVSLAGGGGGITTIDGDTGSVTGSTVSIISNVAALGAGSTVQFTGSGTTLTYSNTDGAGNIAIGLDSGNPAISGSRNTALGFEAQTSLTTGSNNVGVGPGALFSETTGSNNVSIGSGAMVFNVAGSNNTVMGSAAAQGSPGGSGNTAIGYEALQQCNTGDNNTALGFQAGHAYNGAESSNIVIGNIGVLNESNVIRIGTQGSGGGQQTSCYIAGIESSTVSGSGVVVNASTGQVGVNGASTNTGQPCFLAYLSTTQNNVTGNGATYTIPFDTVVFDQNSNYNNSTGVFTAPVTGKYFFTAEVLTLNQTSVTYSAQILEIVATSITIASRVDQPISNAVGFSIGYAVSGIVPMTAGDTCSINLLIGGNGTNGTSVFGSAPPCYTHFSGNLVC
jgi:hypothetical protein